MRGMNSREPHPGSNPVPYNENLLIPQQATERIPLCVTEGYQSGVSVG
jgi:hypothetical protein